MTLTTFSESIMHHLLANVRSVEDRGTGFTLGFSRRRSRKILLSDL